MNDGPTFLKQYGERRTGTNYVRWFVQANLEEVVVLMHILGDKHGPPAPLEQLWREAQSAPDPSLQFVRAATYGEYARTDHRATDTDRQNVDAVASALAAAYARNAFGYLVTIKDPYAWALSIASYERWAASEHATQLRKHCASFNAHYAAWLELPGAMVVRYESLLLQPESVLEELTGRFRLRRRAHRVKESQRQMSPMIYDHEPIQATALRFDPTYYTERCYLQRLHPDHAAIVTDTIDWRIFEPYGYSPLNGR